jgi:prepilin-type N-terminal cleavage/methylation domain-containing protein
MKNQKGFTLIEVLVSLAIFALIVMIVLGGLGTASRTIAGTDVRETAKNLAEKQMEYIKGLPFAGTYSPQSSGPEYQGFAAAIHAASLEDVNIQKITVTINWSGRPITTLEGYKVK